MIRALVVEMQGGQLIRLGDEEFRVLFPFPVVVELEKKLGRPMRSAPDFLRMTAEEVPAILEAGLTAHYADRARAVSLAILDGVGIEAESFNNLMDFLCVAAFPKSMAKIDEVLKRIKTEARPKNVPSAGVC
jgi:hypothetical protein